VVLGADATVASRWHSQAWLRIATGPVPLAALFCCHDLLITRAGRNTVAEATYCGIPAVVLPVAADPHRAGEQQHNAVTVAGLPSMFSPRRRKPTDSRSLTGTLPWWRRRSYPRPMGASSALMR
jgi:predicted glycosyltransferase